MTRDMRDAIEAGDCVLTEEQAALLRECRLALDELCVLTEEQAALLRECRLALDELISKKPRLAGLWCGSRKLGNLKAALHAYRPQGVFEVRND